MIYVDSREKKWQHIAKWFDEHGVEYTSDVALATGDYINPNNPKIIVDRKANLTEIAGNLSLALMKSGKTNESRFRHEVERAYRDRVRFVVLVEGTNCKDVHDVANIARLNKYTQHTGRWLFEKMFEFSMAYGVEWEFCHKNETARRICELLEVEYDKGRD